MTETHRPRRSITVDNMKGVAILVVVFAHITLGLNKTGHISDGFIYGSMPFYLWYMAAFFFASGLFMEKGLHREGPWKFILNKAVELGYPFIIWSFIFGVTQMVFSSYTNTGSIGFSEVLTGLLPWKPRDHMWFLPALFLAFAVAATAFRLGGPRWKTLLLSFALGMAAMVAVLPSWNQQLQYTLWLSTAALIASTSFGGWVKGASASVRSVLSFLTIAAIFVFIILVWVGPGRDFYLDVPSLVLGSGIGILGLVALSRITAAISGLGPFLARLGRWSLHIYLTHVPVLAAVRVALTRFMGLDSPVIITATSLVVCVAIGCAFGYLSERSQVSILFRPPQGARSSGKSMPVTSR
ncbi:acyltransferase family protein [Arthrobacter yangruifuii]|uniref:Acyltransferase family protein n=1 Tax=Arthrobacter yangruifuii TaxID=2606616 RepID=A0A5N6MG26_9MICC|nr:acyltransferase [Arthrobacter yangruifuii]KAD3515264.1 acyltransferase family protein [Arthrobacter yangruifuii]